MHQQILAQQLCISKYLPRSYTSVNTCPEVIHQQILAQQLLTAGQVFTDV
jgi:hypothetical protein